MKINKDLSVSLRPSYWPKEISVDLDEIIEFNIQNVFYLQGSSICRMEDPKRGWVNLWRTRNGFTISRVSISRYLVGVHVVVVNGSSITPDIHVVTCKSRKSDPQRPSQVGRQGEVRVWVGYQEIYLCSENL